ncbi:MAG: hypothetical protein JXQ90_04400 [Cyclobacteriaceae bacterium]
MNHFRKTVYGLGIYLIGTLCSCSDQIVDRQVVVDRHNVRLTEIDTLGSLTLGNGRFAMTMDVTGLQSFPEAYAKGVPLGTQSEWGWHSFPGGQSFDIKETLMEVESHDRLVPYAVQWPLDSPQSKAANYIRQNPHRIHLGQVGFKLLKADGTYSQLDDLKAIEQELDMWSGILRSKFMVGHEIVEVESMVHPDKDELLVAVKSTLLNEGRLSVSVKFPFPTDKFLDEGVLFDAMEDQRLSQVQVDNNLEIKRKLDATIYYTTFQSEASIEVTNQAFGYLISPDSTNDQWIFSVTFSQEKIAAAKKNFDRVRQLVSQHQNDFWNNGAMIDFGRVEDPRALELERRMILSRYLAKVNCGGSTPPQETGLTYNSWYGRPHMEMAWWHSVHFALWGNSAVLDNHMDWYLRNMDGAKKIAERQGFKGVRWQKMTDPWGGETVSSVGSYLIWQQPHVIYFAELLYQSNASKELLNQYAQVIHETADFMADFAHNNGTHLILGPGVIPAQERFDPKTTYNPTFELAYWRWGLEHAQQWRIRLGESRNKKWDDVLERLAVLPQKDGRYLATANSPDSYSNPKYMTDHPSVLGAFGMLPKTEGLDEEIMRKTLDLIWSDWHWEETWGWDFPMVAMTATRLGDTERAIQSLLMPITTNTFLVNGHNYQNERLRVYLPGNGGVLIALALMVEEHKKHGNGFPSHWDVRYSGFKPFL